MAEVLVPGVILGMPLVLGAVVYAVGVRRPSRLLRVAGVTIAFGTWVVLAVLVALTSE